MLICEDEKPSRSKLDTNIPVAPADEPPPYTPSTTLPARIRPVNYLYVTRTGETPIHDAFLVDPLLAIPEAVLPRLPPRQDGTQDRKRRNLRLESRDGAIDADVWIVPRAAASLRAGRNSILLDGRSPSRTLVDVVSQSGPITLRLHTPTPGLSLMDVTVNSVNSSISILLPRTFRGSLVSKGTVNFSSDLDMDVTVLEQTDNTWRCWLGPFEDEDGTDAEPSMLHLESEYGAIYLGYEDEDEGSGIVSSVSSIPPTPVEPFGATLPDVLTPPTSADNGRQGPRIVSANDPPVNDRETCPQGWVAWLIQRMERSLAQVDVKIEMRSLPNGHTMNRSNPAAQHPSERR